MKISNSVKSNPNQTFFSALLFMCTTIIYLLPLVECDLYYFSGSKCLMCIVAVPLNHTWYESSSHLFPYLVITLCKTNKAIDFLSYPFWRPINGAWPIFSIIALLPQPLIFSINSSLVTVYIEPIIHFHTNCKHFGIGI